jgi:hypothetical protein
MAGTSVGFLLWYLNLDLNLFGVKSAFSGPGSAGREV